MNNSKHIPYLTLRVDAIEISCHVSYYVSYMHSITAVPESDLEI
jgi:hypothetical protein